MKNNNATQMQWKANVKALFEEIIENGGHAVAATHMPLKITYSILREVANRANELGDPKLNALMCRLALYEESDPFSEHYIGDKKLNEIIQAGQ